MRKSTDHQFMVLDESSAYMLKSPRRMTGIGMKIKTELFIKVSFTENEAGRPRSD